MTKLNNLDEIGFPLIMSYDTEKGKVKYVRDIIKTEISKHIHKLEEHLTLGPKGLICPIFEQKIVCTECNTAHYLKKLIGVEDDESARKT